MEVVLKELGTLEYLKISTNIDIIDKEMVLQIPVNQILYLDDISYKDKQIHLEEKNKIFNDIVFNFTLKDEFIKYPKIKFVYIKSIKGMLFLTKDVFSSRNKQINLYSSNDKMNISIGKDGINAKNIVENINKINPIIKNINFIPRNRLIIYQIF